MQTGQQTRKGGIDIGRHQFRKGSPDAIAAFSTGDFPEAMKQVIEEISLAGGTALAVAEKTEALGVIHLKDVVKPDIKDRFAALRRMGIKTVMITGDNPVTAAAIASEAGVDDFIAQATPEVKLKRIRAEQAQGHLIAMIGDGTLGQGLLYEAMNLASVWSVPFLVVVENNGISQTTEPHQNLGGDIQARGAA